MVDIDPSVEPPKRKQKTSWKEVGLAAALILPNLVLLGIFTYRPLVDNIRLSFYHWNISSTRKRFIGFDNYVEWFTARDTAEKVARAATMLELEPLLDVKPGAMSGGQRQRVAMGRAIVRDPKVFCMDEPLSNLDAKLRVATRAQISALQRELGVTTVYVTHDQTEAMTMGDRVCVLKDGIIQQVDDPTHLYEHPANTCVAGFIGSPAITLMEGVAIEDGRAVMGEGHTVDLGILPERAARARGGRVIAGVRPEAWEIVSGEDRDDTVPLKVVLAEHLGSEVYLYCDPQMTPDSTVLIRGGRVVLRADKRHQVEVGEVLRARPRFGESYFFDPETEVNLEYLA